ncbi:MAG: hypothetical protein ACE5FL_15055, partial [Myxococcota bacterium]
TVLVLLLAGLQHGYYALAGSHGYTFTEFTARHLPMVFLLSKLLMTILHLISFYVLYEFSKRLLRSVPAAFFATLGYATSLPIFYYLSRISVEPLVVTFFLVSLLAVWRHQELAIAGRRDASLAFVALAAAASVSGAMTKLNFLGPLPFLLMLYLMAGGWREVAGGPLPWRARGLALLTFAGTGTVLTALYSVFVDWKDFFETWRNVATALPLKDFRLAGLLPGRTPQGAFMLCELPFLVFGVAGLVLFVRRVPERRMRTLWFAAYAGWGLLLFAYRAAKLGNLLAFHYFHLTDVAVSVFFGYLAAAALDRLPARSSGWRVAAVGVAGISAIHAIAIWTVVDSRRFDVASYAPNREIHEVIARLEPGQRIGCPGCAAAARTGPHSLYALHAVGWQSRSLSRTPGRESWLRLEFESLFTTVDAREGHVDTHGLDAPALRARIVVLDPPEDAGGG